MGRRGECERGVVFRWVVVGGRGVQVITISLVTVNPHDPCGLYSRAQTPSPHGEGFGNNMTSRPTQ